MGTCGQYNMKFFKCSAAFEMHFKSIPMLGVVVVGG